MAEEQSEKSRATTPTLPETPGPIVTVLDEEASAVEHNIDSPSEKYKETPKSVPRHSTTRTVFHQRRGDDDTL